ncbi:uncharacterized protein EV154DRAFT_555341 [Mucor mucedo]|uniref:uncharacterized protein n=1 Tax=Mucor mucedo TaxID=29922 RepID=UPI00221F3AF1|nr:uncharacterized protein EV154DRAFT_555341 [Mucor mucedo]KAI7880294.1 hypothetical protein EV154DRAFT_555341 [Mucor mucedo]
MNTNNTGSLLNLLKKARTSNTKSVISELKFIKLTVTKDEFKSWITQLKEDFLCTFIDRTSSAASLQDLRTGPSNRIISDFVMEQVEKNIFWSDIKGILQLVHYAMKKTIRKRAMLSQDNAKSMDLWSTKITTNEDIIMVSFMSEWQLKLLERDGDMLSLDSTHNTCTCQDFKYCSLYMIVARCSDTGKGKPLVWIFTRS